MFEQLLYESQPDEEDFAAKLTRYIYSNHLQSASLELDDEAEIISYEEYHPYGTTSYQAMNALVKASAKRYRYTGKERDEESGLYYHGARYYIPWLCRWSASDPMESKYAGMSSYNYSFNNPVMWNDPSGADPRDGDNIKGYNQLTNETAIINRKQVQVGEGIREAVAAYHSKKEFTNDKGVKFLKYGGNGISEEYKKVLSKFEPGGEYAFVQLSYSLFEPGDEKGLMGEVVPMGTINGVSKPIEGMTAEGLQNVTGISLEIQLNNKMDYFTALETLNHELTVHAVALAEAMKANKGDILKTFYAITQEKSAIHHQLMDTNATYQKIQDQVISALDFNSYNVGPNLKSLGSQANIIDALADKMQYVEVPTTSLANVYISKLPTYSEDGKKALTGSLVAIYDNDLKTKTRVVNYFYGNRKMLTTIIPSNTPINLHPNLQKKQ